MSKKREIFNILDRDCVSPVTREYIKEYIENLHQEINKVNKKKSKGGK